MKKIIFITILLILLGTVAAQSLESEVSTLAAEAEGQVLEGPLATLFGNQRINIYITLESEEQFILGLVTKKKVVKSLEAGAVSKPSLKIYTTEKVLAEIQSSNDASSVLKDALDKGEITYEAIGLFNKIKFGMISVFVNIIDSFSGEDKEEVIVADEKDEAGEETTLEDPVEPEPEPTPEPEEEAEVTVEEDEVEEPEITTHTVKMDDNGFSVSTLSIKVGDTVTWENIRTGTFKTAFVIGTQLCIDAKSGIFNNGETYSYTFNEAMICTVVDGILTTESMKVIVE